ncbi:hypothetical protein GE061_000994 [Apolygus lucorum]|uniref:Uncharacterized protein n=1 Tax=Apolygus lucorum TaxID=248454 RepID=A0A8S9Y834_APOLU|nr:hypothetical protein GE061_000994 [Apolygus lucorum]
MGKWFLWSCSIAIETETETKPASSFWSPSHDRNNLTVTNQEDLNQSEFHNVDASAEKTITESLISQDGSPQKSLSLPETAEAPTQSESAKTPSLSDSASLESKAGVLSKEEPILKDVHRKSIVFEGPAVAKSPLSVSTASTDSEYSPLATPIREIGDGVVNESITPTQVDVNHATPSQVGDGQVNSSCKKDILLASEDAEDELIPDSGSSGGLTELEIAGEVVDSCISAATSSIILNGADSGDSNVSHSNSGSAVTVSESCAHSSSNDVAVESVDSSCTDSTINEEPECKSSTAGKVHQEVIQTSEEGTESVPPKDLNVKSSEQPDVTIAGNAIEQEACAIPNGNTMLTEELSGTAAPNHAGQSSQPSPDGSEVHVNVEGEKKEAVNVQDPDKLEVEVSQSGAESAVQVCISDEARSCEDLVAENKNFSISSISNEANSEPVLSTIDDSVVPPKSIEEVQKFEDDAVSTSELPEVPSIDSNVKSLNSSEQAHVTLAENAAIIPNDTAMHNDQSEVKSDMTATNQAEQSCQIVTTPEIETVIESDVSQFDPESVVQVSDTHDAPSFKKNPVELSQDSTCASSESVLSAIDESKSTLESLEGAQKTVSVDESQLPGLVLPNDSSMKSMSEMNHVADDGNVAIQVATESISNGTIVLGVQTDVVSPVEVTPSEAQSAVQCDSHQESSAEEDLSAHSKDSSNESATLNVVHSQPDLGTIEGSVPFRKSPEQAQTSEEVISQLPGSVVTEDSSVKSRSDVPQAGNDIAEEVSRTTIPNDTFTLADQAKTVHESLSDITASTPTENSSKILPSPVGSEVSNVTEHAKETKQGSVAVEVEFGKPASMGESFVVTKNDSQLPKMETKAGPIDQAKTVHESLSDITASNPTENSSKILPSPVGSEVSSVTEHAKETKRGSVAVEVEFGKPASMGESFVVTKNDSQLPKMETKAGPIESIKVDFSCLPGPSKEETEELNLEIKSFHLSPENIDKAMDQSYKDLSQILATCSKQEQELGGQIDFSCIQAEAARIASDLNLANEAKLPGQSNKQPMMQSSLLSAETNNSEAGPVTADEDFNNE